MVQMHAGTDRNKRHCLAYVVVFAGHVLSQPDARCRLFDEKNGELLPGATGFVITTLLGAIAKRHRKEQRLERESNFHAIVRDMYAEI